MKFYEWLSSALFLGTLGVLLIMVALAIGGITKERVELEPHVFNGVVRYVEVTIVSHPYGMLGIFLLVVGFLSIIAALICCLLAAFEYEEALRKGS